MTTFTLRPKCLLWKAELQHWRASQAIYGWRGALVLEFVFEISLIDCYRSVISLYRGTNAFITTQANKSASAHTENMIM